MHSVDFGKCRERSIHLTGRLQERGENARVAYGLFIPDKPRYLWDDRWAKTASVEFVHFWTEVDGMILDCSAQQFGEPEYCLFVSKADSRYKLLGYVLSDGQLYSISTEIRIRWETLSEREGTNYIVVEGLYT